MLVSFGVALPRPLLRGWRILQRGGNIPTLARWPRRVAGARSK
jgi:hypothetical protein